VALTLASAVHAQLTPADTVFAGLSARTRQMAYQAAGGDMSAITPLMADRSYRGLTHAMVVMSGKPWTPDNELTTAVDFAIGAKVVGTGENLSARATLLFDPPDGTQGPYRLQLDLLKADGAVEVTVEPGIALGGLHGRKALAFFGLTFDPSKLTGPGLHLVRATLMDSHDAKLFEYYRSFFVVSDLAKRVAALEKTLELLPDQRSSAALSLRQTIESIQTARESYYAPGFQSLAGYVFNGMRAAGLGLTEAVDYEAALGRATMLADSLKDGKDPFAAATGELAMAYRSSFDGKLVPYRVFVPSNYNKSKKYPLLVMLHGAGGNETDFVDAYRKLFPKFAEERGYIIASVNGRGPLSGYTKESGGEQDVLDVADLMKKNYSVDASRVYLGGHSMGGGGTWRLGLLYADRWAGLIPLAGSNPSALPGYEALLKTRKLPIMMVCGEKDALVAVAGCRTIAEKTKAIDAPLKYAEYPGADHLSVVPISVKDVFDWLDSQAKKRTAE
jgi:poly(3-hydroxybutyrate) depolymerase